MGKFIRIQRVNIHKVPREMLKTSGSFFFRRLKRELEEEKAISKLNANKATSPTVKTVIIKPASRKKRGNKGRNMNGNANRKVGVPILALLMH